MPSLTVENYVKTIYQISAAGEEQDSFVTTGCLAAALGVSPGTVTSMLKTLGESNLVSYAPYEGVQLTPAGIALALRILRRHRLIELFLVRTLKLNWDEVHEEAENMEHAVSDRLIDRLDEFLGFPDADPHGDPIPRSDGSFEPAASRALAECQAGESFCLSRVVDQSPEFLRFLSGSGLPLGAAGRVVSNQAEAGLITVDVKGKTISLGRTAAQKLLVAGPAGK